MELSDTTRNERIINVTIDEKELESIAVREVLKEAGITWNEGVTCRAYHSSRDTSTGFRHDMKVEIIADLSVLPREG